MKDPEAAAVHLTRAEVLCSFGKYNEARAEIGSALSLQPSDSRILGQACVIEACLGNVKEAMRFAGLSTSSDPTWPA